MGNKTRVASYSGRALARAAVTSLIILTLTTCDAFKAGLGPKIDISGPTVNVKSIANGAYLKGTVVISGEDTDVLSVQSVSILVSINSVQVVSIPATLSTGGWSASLDTKALTDKYGDTQANLDIKVVAGSGKTTDDKLVVYLDNTPPVFSSMTPSQAQLSDNVTYDYALSQQEAITGSVNDFGLNTVELDMGTLKPVVVTTKSAFSFSIDATQFYQFTNPTTLTALNGAVSQSTTPPYLPLKVPYSIIATDFAGNKSTITGNFYVRPGLGAPIITFTNPSAFNTTTAYFPYNSSMGAVNSIKPGSAITFHAFDMDGLDTTAGGLYVAFQSKVANPTLDYTDAFNSSTPGSYTLYTIDHGLTLTPMTTLQLPGGTTIVQGADITFTIPTTPLGEYSFLIQVSDLASNKINLTSAVNAIPASPNSATGSRFASFFISNSNPEVTTLLADGAFLHDLNATGTVIDAAGPLQIDITITGTTITGSPVSNPVVTLPLTPSDPATANWSYATTLPDGTYTITLVGVNQQYASTQPAVTRRFTIDSTPPNVVITQPVNHAASESLYWLSGATASFQGTATDPNSSASGVANVYYKVDTLGTNHASDNPVSAGWTSTAGTSIWSVTENLGTLGEGQYTLWIAAYDNVGNLCPISSRNFGVDQNPPTLTETNHPATSFTKSAFTLAGAIGDTNSLASLTITESKNGGTATPVTFTSTPSSFSGLKTATYSSQALPLGGVVGGSYAYVLTATDIAAKTTTVNRTVNIDTTPPTIALNAIPVWISATAYTISGTATDPGAGASGVATIQYSLDGGTTWANAVWTDTSGGANTSGTWNATLSGLVEGNHSVIVRANDAASNTTTLGSAAFGVDLNPPVLGVANVPATITAATGASFPGLSGTLYDTNPAGLATLVVTSTQNGSTVAFNTTITYPGTSTVSGNPWSYAFSVDTAGHSTDGLWSFVFTATDVSGKVTSVTKTITIDTLPPTTTVTSPSSGAWVSTTSLSVTGVASDGSGTGVSKVYVKADGLYVASGPTDHSAEDPTVLANGWTTATGQSNWSASLTLSGEGRKTLWIKAIDVAGNLTTAAGAISSRVDFGLDLNPPALGFTDSVSSLVDSAFTLVGTTTDTNPAGLPTLTVVVNGGASQAVTVTGGAWSFPVAVDAVGHTNDGSRTYVFTATDVAGKTTTLSRTITIDSTPPTTAITQPGSYTSGQPQYWLSGATASLAGSAADPGSSASGVAKVYYKVDALGNSHASDNSSTITGTWTLAAGTGTWSATANLGTLGEGQFTLWTAAYDNAGNLSSISSRNFGVDQNPPTLTETNHSATSSTKATYTLAGAIGDTNSLGSLGITESKNGGSATPVTFTSTPSSLAGVQSAAYASASLPLGVGSIDTGSTHSNDGSYVYVLTATDVAGKTTTVNRTVSIDTTPPMVNLNAIPSWISATAYTISGIATDPGAGASGVATIQYSLDGGTTWANAVWTDTSGGANTSGTWNATLSGLVEGNHSVIVRANDAASNTTTLGSAAFGVDLNPPVLGVANVPATITAATGASFPGLSGTLYDTNPAGLASLAVTSTKNGSTVAFNASIPCPGTSTVSGNPWSYAFSVDTAGHSTDGLWSFVFTATDVSGKVTSVTKTITIDTLPPTTTVTSPSTGAWVSTTALSVTGVASDGSGTGVSKVYVKADDLYVASGPTDHSVEDPTVPANGWTTATGQSNWSASLNLSGEGRKTLWVKAIDVAGNLTTSAGAISSRVDFGLDLNPPVLGFTDSVSSLVNSAFALAGTTTDTNPAGLPTLAVVIDGGASQAVTVTGGVWSFPVAVDTVGHTNDGSHTYVFTATDVAGKTTTLSRTITIDSTPPTTAITQPGSYTSGQPQYWLSGATASLAGSAADPGSSASGVAKVYYKVDALGTSHAGENPVSQGWTLAAGTGTWSATINLSSEGQFTLWTAAYDNAGNLSAISSRNFGVDQNPPTLTETNHPATSFTKATYTLAGAIGDTNSLGSLAITESKNGGTATPVTFTSTPSSLAGVQSAAYTSASLPFGVGSIDTVTHGNDGSYAYVLTATDVAGKITTVNRTVSIDTTPPTVILNAIPAWVSSAAYTISGTATDSGAVASGVATIQYSLDGGTTWTNAAWTDTSGGANTAGTWSATLSGLTEGNHSIIVRANDAATNSTTLAAVPFGVDFSPPNLTVVAVPATINAASAAGFAGFSGTLYDTNPAGLATLVVSSTQNGTGVSSAVSIVPTGSSDSSGNPWSWTPFSSGIDLASHSNDGLWSFTFTATDVAGKQVSITQSLTIDTQAPVTTITSPSTGAWVSTTSLSVTGVASDGSGTGVSKVYVKADGLYVASGPTDHSAEDPTVGGNGWTLATGQTNWSASLALSGEGRKTLWIKAIDVAGNLTTSAGAISSRVDFGLDLNPPTLASTDAVGNLVKASFALAGTISDSNPASIAGTTLNLAVTVDGGSSTPIALGSASWTYPFTVNAATHAQDGIHTFVFTGTDVAGKPTTLTRTVTVDTQVPSTTITNPGSYTASQALYWISGATATFGGSAFDLGTGASGVAAVYYKIDAKGVSHAADPNPAGTWSLATGTTTWTAANVNLGTLGEGQFTLWVAGYDNAGNLSTFTTQDFGVDQSPPTLTETTRNGVSSAGSQFQLAGKTGDSNALASLTVTEVAATTSVNAGSFVIGKDYTISVVGTTDFKAIGASSNDINVQFTATGAGIGTGVASLTTTTAVALATAPGPVGTNQSWQTVSLPLGGIVSGSFKYIITATDVALKPTTLTRTVSIDTTPPTAAITPPPAWISSTSYTISGSATDPGAGASGIATIQYQLDGGAFVAANWYDTSGGGDTLGTWNASLTGLAEGSHSVVIKATDAAGNTYSTSASNFGVDLTPPTLSVAATPAYLYGAGASSFTAFTGGLGDSNPSSILGSTLTLNFTSTKNGTIVNNSTSVTAASSWTFPFAVDAVGHTTDGAWIFTFVATDVAGKTTTVVRNMTIDTQAPSTTVTAPSPGGWASSSILSVTGAATDGNGTGVAAVYVKVDNAYVASTSTDHSAEDPTAGANNWTLATGQTSWHASLTVTGEGYKTLWVKAIDVAGNAPIAADAVASIVNFGVDLNPPALASSDSVNAIVNAGFTLAGTITDSNPASIAGTTLNLAVAVDGGSSTPIALGSGSWTYGFAVNAVSHAQDGTHTFVFTGTDIAGKSVNLVRTITVDTIPVSLIVASPAAGLATGSTSVSIAGTANDGIGSGVKEVWYYIDGAVVAHAGDAYGASGWVKATGTTNWSATVSGLSEGIYNLLVKALDNAGNYTPTASATSFNVDVTAPTLTESSVASASGYADATFTLGGASSVAVDPGATASGIASFTVSDNGGSPSSIAIVAGVWSKSIAVDTAGHTNDGTHTYVFTLTDNAGNHSVLSRTVVVDTTPAVDTVIAPAANSYTKILTIGLSGSANDGAGSGVSEVWYYVDGAVVTHAGDAYGASGWTKVGGTTNWSAATSVASEGVYNLLIKVLDKAGNYTPTASSTKFTVDTTPPTLSESSPTTTAGYANASFSFGATTGVATDAGSGIASFTVSDNGGAAVAVTPGASWTKAIAVDTTGHSNDGTHSYVFTLTDNAGNASTLTKTVVIDTTPAMATITTPAIGSYTKNTTISLSGSANDGSGTGVSQVWYRIDAAAIDHSGDAYNAAGWAMASSTTNWTATASGLTEGAKRLWVKALDVAGNVTSGVAATAIQSGQSYYITSAGNTDFTAIGASSSTAGVVFTATGSGTGTGMALPGVIPFTVDTTPPSLSESSPVTTSGYANAAFSFGATTGVATDAGSGIASFTMSDNGGAAVAVTPGASWTKAIAVDTTGHANDGTHTYVFTLTDNAGNVSTLTKTVVIDTVPATAIITTPAIGSYTKNTTISLSGSANDGSGTGVSQVWYKINTGADASGEAPTVPNGWTMASSTTNWTATASGLTEGAKRLWVKVIDVAGNVTSTVAATAIQAGQSYYITSAGNTDFTAIGASSSTAGVVFTATGSGTGTGMAFPCVIPFTVDTTPPTLTESSPTTTTGHANASFSFGATTGVATDAGSGIASFTMSDNGGAAVAVTPGASWTKAIAVDMAGHANDGTHTYVFTLTDNAGNVSTLTRTVVIDTVPATATVTTPAANGFTNQINVSLLGSANDGSGSGVSQVWYKINTGADASGEAPTVPNGWTMASSTTNWTATASGLTEGAKRLWVKVIDVAGNVTSAVAATAIQAGQSYYITSAGNTDFTAIGASSSTAGVVFTATGSGTGTGMAFPCVVPFTVDRTPPSLSESSPTTTAGYASAAFSFGATTGVATDAGSGIASFTMSDNGGAAVAVTPGASWTKAITVDTAGHTNDGTHTYVFTLTDNAGNIQTMTRTVNVDSSPATAAVTAPSAGGWVDTSSYTLSGSANDGAGTGVSQVWYRIDAAANDHSGDAYNASGWRQASGTTNWTAATAATVTAGNFVNGMTYMIASVGTTDFTLIGASANTIGTVFTATGAGAGTGTASVYLADGAKKLWIKTLDVAGNVTAPIAATSIQAGQSYYITSVGTTNFTAIGAFSNTVGVTFTASGPGSGTGQAFPGGSVVSFSVDTTPPNLSINALTAYNAAFTIMGSTADTGTNPSGVASLQYKIDSGSLAAITLPVFPATSWSASIPAGAFSSLLEGPHTVYVIATDVAGNQTTQTSSFRKDMTPPSLSYSNIQAGGGTVDQDTNPIISGALTDASGVHTATYTLQVWNYNAAAWNTVVSAAGTSISGISLGSPGDATNFAWSVDLSSDGSGLSLPDGKYQISIASTDIAGNASTPTYTYFLLSRASPQATVTSPGFGTFQPSTLPLVGTLYDMNGIASIKAKVASGTPNFSSGTTSALAALPVTVSIGNPGSFTTALPHGLSATDPVYVFANPMPTSGATSLAAGTVYYVATPVTANSFALSTTSGGAAMAITTNTASSVIVASTKFSFMPAQPVTVSSSTFTAANHGMANGQVVYLQGTTLPSPTLAGQAYYIVNAAANTFQISLTSGGGPLTLGTTGSSVSAFSPNQPINWMVPALPTNLADGPMSAYLQVTGNSGKTTVTSRDFTQDTAAPTIAVSSPASAAVVDGNITLVGTSNDPGAVPSGVTGSIQYQIGNGANLSNSAAGWTSANVTGGSYSWSIALGDAASTSNYANATYATQCDATGNTGNPQGYWKLPIYFQTVDKAGNFGQLTTYYLILYPAGNIPAMAVSSPTTGGIFSGTQRITGTAAQPVYVHDVEIAVDPNGGNNFPANPVSLTLSNGSSTITSAGHPFTAGMMLYISGSAAPQIGGTNVAPTTPYWVVSATAGTFQVAASSGGTAVTFSGAGSGVTASVWTPATLSTTGNNVIWYYDLNGTSAYPQGGATNQKISVQARGWNSPTVGGARGTVSGLLASPLVMNFNASLPSITSVVVNGTSYVSGMGARGNITLTATAKSSKGIAKIQGIEGSPLGGTNSLFDTTGSYSPGSPLISGSNGAYWTSTVTPPASMTSDTFGGGNTKQVMITVVGSNPSLWTGAGSPIASVGTVFTPVGVTLNVAGSGGSFIESDGTGNFNYGISMTLNSSAVYPSTTGQYVLNLSATDTGSPAQAATATITLNEDNYYPTTTLTNPQTVAAGAFVVGQRYAIATLGSTDFTLAGAISNTVGTTFVATGAGAGTGTAIPVLVGTIQKIQGSANDVPPSGNIGGISKIVVYITTATGAPIGATTMTAGTWYQIVSVGSTTFTAYGAASNTVGTIFLANAAGTGSGTVKTVKLLNMKTGNGTAGDAVSSGTTTAKDVTGTNAVTSVPYPTSDAYTPTVVGAAYFASIDSLAEVGVSDANGDGFLESFMINNNNRDWWVQLDTTKLPDGPVTVHTVVWDNAGNESHYAQATYVANTPPSITNLTVGGTAVTAGGQAKVAGILNFVINATSTPGLSSPAGFQLKVASRYAVGSGSSIGAKDGTYSTVTIWGAGGTAFDSSNATSATKSIDTSTFTAGYYYLFQAVATDVNGNSGEQDSYVWITAGDTVAPTVVFPDLNQGNMLAWTSKYTPMSLDVPAASVSTATGAISVAMPSWVTASSGSYVAAAWADGNAPAGFTPGSLYYISANANPFTLSATPGGAAIVPAATATGATYHLAVGGHVEAKTTNLYSANASVSGSVNLLGTAGDDNNLVAVGLQIDGAGSVTLAGSVFTSASAHGLSNGAPVLITADTVPTGLTSGTTYYVVAATTTTFSLAISVNGAALTGLGTGVNIQFWNAAVMTNKTGNSVTGFTANWSYLWDTSRIAAVAKANVSIKVMALDGQPTSAKLTTTTQSKTVDVLPYISTMSDPTGLPNSVFRGSSGIYTIASSATNKINMYGYNLGRSGSTVLAWNGNTTTSYVTGGTTASLSPTPDATYPVNLVAVPKNWTRSGYFTVTVGGIPSGNNLENDNGSSANAESTLGSPTTAAWTDNRFLRVWATTQIAPTSMAAGSPVNATLMTYYNPEMVVNPTNDQPEFAFNDDNGGVTAYTNSDTQGTEKSGFRKMAQAGFAGTTIGGTYNRFFATGFDSEYNTNDNTGFLEVMGWNANSTNNINGQLFGPSVPTDGGVNWVTIQGNDYLAPWFGYTAPGGQYRYMSRFPHPQLIAKPAPAVNSGWADMYLSYYDASPYSQNINFISFAYSNVANGAGNYLTSNTTNITTGEARNASVMVVPGTEAGHGSSSFAMAQVGTQGIAIAYFDPISNCLRLATSPVAFITGGTAGAGGTDNKTNLAGANTVQTSAVTIVAATTAAVNGFYFTVYDGSTPWQIVFDTSTTANSISGAQLRVGLSGVGNSAAAIGTAMNAALRLTIGSPFRDTPVSATAVSTITNVAPGPAPNPTTGTMGTNVTLGATTAGTTNWSTMTVDPNAGVGQNVSIASDGTNLYLAYQDTNNGQLKFARISWTGTGTPGTPTIATIDGAPSIPIAVGSWSNVMLLNLAKLPGLAGAVTGSVLEPVIAYYADSYGGSKNSIRFAVPQFDATSGTLYNGVNGDNTYTGKWETATLQAIGIPTGGDSRFNQVQLGSYSTSSLPVVGWVTTKPEYAKLQPNN